MVNVIMKLVYVIAVQDILEKDVKGKNV